MNLIDDIMGRLAALRADRAKHVIGGAIAAGVAAPVSAALFARLFDVTPLIFVLAGVVAIAAAWGAGRWKESADAEANAIAEAAGMVPPHEVSQGDIDATAVGGVLVAIPMWLLALAAWLT